MELEAIGLNKYESKVYQTLLFLGEAKPSQLAVRSKVPYGRIYDILEVMVEKGFIKIIKPKPKTYAVTDPEIVLTKEIDNRIRQLKKLKEDIKRAEKAYTKLPEDIISIVKSKENFHRLLGAFRGKPEKFEYSIKYNFETHPVWMREDKSAVIRGLDVKALGPLNVSTKENIKKWLKIHEKIHEFPNDGVAAFITDKGILISLIKSDVVLWINDQAFTSLMKNLYEAAWKQSKEIKLRDLK